MFRAEGMRVVETPIVAPRANAHIERQIGSGRRDCLDWVLIVGAPSLGASAVRVDRALQRGPTPSKSGFENFDRQVRSGPRNDGGALACPPGRPTS